MPVISVNSWTWYIIAPFKKKFVASLPPPKIAIFLAQCYPPIFEFKIVLLFIIVTMFYTLHLVDNAGVVDIILSVKSLGSHICKEEDTFPCISSSH